jgi:AcrR family transcriptional regulator
MAREAVRRRKPPRRELILDAALGLFHDRGYHATGIDDIGAVAGITGPGIYRHFRNKQEILETLIRDLGDQVMAQVEAAAASDLPPLEGLEALTRAYVEGVASQPSLAVVAMFERHTLSPDAREWTSRAERRNLEEWVRVVRELRTDLEPAEAALLVQATLTMGVAVANYRSGLDAERLVGILHPMVITAILGRAPAR